MRSKRLISKETISVKATVIRKPENAITRASLRRRIKIDQEQQGTASESNNHKTNDKQKTSIIATIDESTEIVSGTEEVEDIDSPADETESTQDGDQDTTEETKPVNFKDIVNVIPLVFPLNISREDVTLIADPVREIIGQNSREVAFVAKYKQVDALCVCIIIYGDVNYHQSQYYYAFDMSERLKVCRNMANQYAIFNCDLPEIIDFIKPPKEPVLLIVKPIYNNGTLSQFLAGKKKEGSQYLEHKYMLQMAISLFSMLADAHALNIGLVDITQNSIYIGDDHGLYFDGFQACIPLEEEDAVHNKSWMDLKTLKCPESYKAKNMRYSAKTDVFFATLLLIDLAKDFKFTQKTYSINRPSGNVLFRREAIHPEHLITADIIESGLKFDLNKRASSADILDQLVKARNKFLSAGVL